MSFFGYKTEREAVEAGWAIIANGSGTPWKELSRKRGNGWEEVCVKGVRIRWIPL